MLDSSDISSSSSRPKIPPRAQDGSALHSLTALPSLGAVITLTQPPRVYETEALCAPVCFIDHCAEALIK